MTAHSMDELRLEVEAATSGLPNLVQNPSGAKGAWGYLTPVTNTAMSASADGDGPYLQFTTSAAQACHWTTEFLPVAASKYVKARFDTVGGTAAYQVKVRFEFYQSNKTTLISSSTQSSGFTVTAQTNYSLQAQAPANTAYVKLRFDFYNGSGGNPSAATYYRFRNVMVTWTDTGTVQTMRTNLITNPSFEGASVGAPWAVAGTTEALAVSTNHAMFGTQSCRARYEGGTMSIYTSTAVTVTGGLDYAASGYVIDGTATGPAEVRLVIDWWNGSTFVSSSTSAWSTMTNDTWKRVTKTATAPSSATRCVMGFQFRNGDNNGSYYLDGVLFEQSSTVGDYFDGSTTDTASFTYDWTGTANASTSTETSAGSTFAFSEPYDWQNILGPTHEIGITRNALDVGLLTATIIDSALDPADAAHVRPGKKIRLQALNTGRDRWESVYEGVLTNAVVTYPRNREAHIVLTATDNIAHLANQGESSGVATIDDLPYILEGKGAPWNVNGYGGQVSAASVVAYNENASVVDQVAITRDSALGYAWVDRNNVLNAWDVASLSASSEATFTDGSTAAAGTVSYTDIDVNFDTDVCINDVTVKWLRYDSSAGATEEITYGPYRDQTSIDTWGAHTATFTIQGGTESEANAAAFATSVIAANGTPTRRPNSLVMPVRNDEERDLAATLDLYSLVTVVYDTKVNDTYRITGIEHRITPKKWFVTYKFAVDGSVAAPTWTPSPPFKGMTATTAYFNNIEIQATSDATTSAGNQPALKIGDKNGQHLRIDGNEILSMSGDATQGNLDLNRGGNVKVGGGQFIKGIAFGSSAFTTDSNSDITITHDLGTTAHYIFLTEASHYGATSVDFKIVTKNTNTTVVRLYGTATGTTIGSGTTRTVNWFAIA